LPNGLKNKKFGNWFSLTIDILREGEPFQEATTDPIAYKAHIITTERVEHYAWKNKDNVYFKRGPALIFSQIENQLTQDLSEALKVLEFKPQILDLCQVKDTLRSGKYYWFTTVDILYPYF